MSSRGEAGMGRAVHSEWGTEAQKNTNIGVVTGCRLAGRWWWGREAQQSTPEIEKTPSGSNGIPTYINTHLTVWVLSDVKNVNYIMIAFSL